MTARLKELGRENACLKRIYAGVQLRHDALQEALEKSAEAVSTRWDEGITLTTAGDPTFREKSQQFCPVLLGMPLRDSYAIASRTHGGTTKSLLIHGKISLPYPWTFFCTNEQNKFDF